VNIFPDLSAEDVERATAEHWDLSGSFPVPRGDWLACPVCRSKRVQARDWTRKVRTGHTITGRVDVTFKCTGCAAVWPHGVAVPDDYVYKHRRRHNERIDWREVKAILEAEAGR
jgi:hypothetical protein